MAFSKLYHSNLPEDMDVEGEEKPKIIILIGPPGSGRASLAQKFSQKYDYFCIRECELIRNAKLKKKNPFHKIITELGANNSPLDRKLVGEMLKMEIESSNRSEKNFLLDDFPKDALDMSTFKEYLQKWVELEMVIFLNCSPAVCANNVMPREALFRTPEDIRKYNNFASLAEQYFNNCEHLQELFLTTQWYFEIDASVSFEQTWNSVEMGFDTLLQMKKNSLALENKPNEGQNPEYCQDISIH